MKSVRSPRNIALMLASALLLLAQTAAAADPPPGLLRKIAERETANAVARENYTYRQSVTIEEFNDHGIVTGQYHEVRDVMFSPNMVRYEQAVESPHSTLTRIRLTPEDFADIRNVDPFLLTADRISLYEAQYKGEEVVEGFPCFLVYIRPKQILSTQRFFEGFLWARESDFAVVRTEGKAVPEIETVHQQNLFPHFTTIRREIDGKWWFPVETYSDDTLFFRDWPQRIRTTVRYLNYQHFGAESTITFGNPAQANPSQPAPSH